MEITVDGKKYKKEDLDLIDSINNTSDEFIYYNQSLYKDPKGKYILETTWQLNPKWCKNTDFTEQDLLPQEEFRAITPEEAEAFLEEAVWNV